MQHLFFQCSFSLECWEKVRSWLQWKCKAVNVKGLLSWIEKRKGFYRFRKDVHRAVLAATIYTIWRARNDILWNKTNISANFVVQRVRYEILYRISQIVPKRIAKKDKEWFDELYTN